MNRHVATASRILLGLIFTIFGANGFLNFIPVPPMPENVTAFMTGVMVAPYFMPLIKACEVFSGILLLMNKQVPLALLILAPISIQIFLFHAYLTPGMENLLMPTVLLCLGITVAMSRWAKFRPLFT
jgi:putative oxidoreductase